MPTWDDLPDDLCCVDHPRPARQKSLIMTRSSDCRSKIIRLQVQDHQIADHQIAGQVDEMLQMDEVVDEVHWWEDPIFDAECEHWRRTQYRMESARLHAIQRAITKIQAAFRGFCVRQKDVLGPY